MSQIPPCSFRITCHGEAELPEDDPRIGTYRANRFIRVGVAAQLTEAMLLVECALERHFDRPPSAIPFSPHHVRITDPRDWLVVGGRVACERIEWLAPAISDDERARLCSEVHRLRDKAAFERGWDNYSTADSLESRADLLELHLVDRTWCASSTLAILTARYRASFREAGLPHEVSTTCPVTEVRGLSYVPI